MDTGSTTTIEELRSRLGDLESRQRAAGGVADAAWAVRSEPDAEYLDLRLSVGLDAAARVVGAWQAPLSFCREGDLIDMIGALGRVQQEREVLLVRVVTELEARGVDSPGGLSRIDWLRAVDPSLTAAAAKAVVTVAQAAVGVQDPSPLEDAKATARRAVHEALLARVRHGSVPVGNAAQVIELGQRLDAVADSRELTATLEHLSAQAASLRGEDLTKECRLHADQLRPPRDLDDLDDARRGARGLWFSWPNKTGMVNLKAVLDPEHAAIVKGAIDPLAAPQPLLDEDTRAVIEPDPRPAHQRRLDALVEIIGRGVAAPEGQQTTDKAKIVVTIDYDTLAGTLADAAGAAARARPGTGWGVSGTGDVLSPSTVRRLACDASLIAAVLGRQGAPLDVARRHRLVTPAMRTALVLRDHGCSFPGCTVPAAWTDAHHVRHWVAGGATSIGNLALLCRRHHTYVHRHDLTATVTPHGVTWHTWQQWRRDRPRADRGAGQPQTQPNGRQDDTDQPQARGPDAGAG